MTEWLIQSSIISAAVTSSTTEHRTLPVATVPFTIATSSRVLSAKSLTTTLSCDHTTGHIASNTSIRAMPKLCKLQHK